MDPPELEPIEPLDMEPEPFDIEPEPLDIEPRPIDPLDMEPEPLLIPFMFPTAPGGAAYWVPVDEPPAMPDDMEPWLRIAACFVILCFIVLCLAAWWRARFFVGVLVAGAEVDLVVVLVVFWLVVAAI